MGLASITEMKKKHNMEQIAGQIHSHPGGLFERFYTKVAIKTKLAKSLEGFSLGDLYHLITGNVFQMTGVAEKENNYFAFRTKETSEHLSEKLLLPFEDFERYWFRQMGVYPITEKMAFGIKTGFDLEKVNLRIAEAYSIAIYKGNPGSPLARRYP